MWGTIIGMGLGAAGSIANAAQKPRLQTDSTLDPLQQKIFLEKFGKEWERADTAVGNLGKSATTLGDTYGGLGNWEAQFKQQTDIPTRQRMQGDINSGVFRDKRHGQINSLLSSRYRESINNNTGLQKQKMYDSERVLRSMLDRGDMSNQLNAAGSINDLGSTLMSMDTGTKVQTPYQDPLAVAGNALNLGGSIGGLIGNSTIGRSMASGMDKYYNNQMIKNQTGWSMNS